MFFMRQAERPHRAILIARAEITHIERANKEKKQAND